MAAIAQKQEGSFASLRMTICEEVKMSRMREWIRRAEGMFRKGRREAELEEELAAHLEMLVEQNAERGMTPEEARRVARIALGGGEQIMEAVREQRGLPWLDSLIADVRFGLRMLAKNPGFTCVAILTLALGIGANTAIFTLIDAVMLRMLPVSNPQELVSLNVVDSPSYPRNIDGNSTTAFPFPAFREMRDRNQVFSSLFAFKDMGRLSVEVNGNAEILHGDLVSPNYFSTLGIRPELGRDFTAADDTPQSQAVAIISFGYWQRRFGGEQTALGKQMVVNDVPVTVAGVAPRAFFGLQSGNSVDLYMDIAMQPRIQPRIADPGTSAFTAPNLWWIEVMGRLKPGVTKEQARTNLDVIYRPMALDGAAKKAEGRTLVPPALEVVDGGHGLEGLRDQFSKPLAILMIVVGIVLLIACVNVANLLLVRAAARQKEIAVRLSLGATRRRLIRQLLMESILLASFGGLVGLLFAYWGCNLLVALMQRGNDRLLINVHPDLSVFAFTAAACVLTGVLFGLAPAFRATHVDLAPALKQTAATSGTTREKMLITRSLVVAQVALSLVLLFAGGLFVRTLVNLETTNIGFSRDNLLLFGIAPREAGYRGERFAELCREIQNRVGVLPGVKSATSSLHLLLSGSRRSNSITFPGQEAGPNEHPSVDVLPVAADFMQTMGIPLLAGRDLNARDDENAPKVALINETMARKYWPGQDPLGRHFKLSKLEMEVVGVVADAKYTSLRREVMPTVYHPYVQDIDSMPQMHFEVRTSGDAAALIPAVRAVVASIDNRLPLFDVRTQAQQIDELLYQERLFAKLVGFFAMLALGLVCVGLYGVTSYAVARRTSEIGIRVALGARQSSILAMVLRETLSLVSIGVALGIGASLVTAKIAAHEVAGLLYGLKIDDVTSIVFAGAAIAVVAALAGLAPARRAMRVDPMVALRHE
ncbi:MAG TPA: ABC transporter permease [Candidatus Acidoferrales bacterium]|nr:ABC transporter permease [Candidatus Acidoferrales bacterium]